MMRVFGMVAAAAMILAPTLSAGVASAQMRGGSSVLLQGRLEEQFALHRLDVMTAAWREQSAPHRVRRAHRAADMINSGDCAGARRLVAHDPLMAYRVGQACGDFDIDVSEPTSVDADDRRATPPRP